MAASLSIDQLVRLAVKKDSLGNLGFSTIAETGALATADLSNLTQDQILRSIFSDNGDGTYGLNLFGIAGGGSGTVTTASVVSANGFTGTVANPTTTPAITVATSVTGLLKGNGTAVSAVVSGTDIKTVNGTSILGSGDLVVSGGYTEYNVAVASSSILIRVTGTASITAAKTNSSTITFTIPASGYLQAFDIYYPSGENPAGTTTLIFNYTSNSAFNQGFSTAKVAYIYGMSGTRIVGARNNSVDILIDATAASGNITHVLTTPAGLNTGDIKLFGSFA